ncbi:MAG TPA: hypothetical protein VHF51_08285 [Solirubrobacteraceae bacterium]|nr:hypothetical protein [Solirubrobacteraceae bacterium]
MDGGHAGRDLVGSPNAWISARRADALGGMALGADRDAERFGVALLRLRLA